MFKTNDGTELFLQIDSVDNPKAVIVIVHGLCEHCSRYDYTTSVLNNAGYSVYRFDHRGHGRSSGKEVYYDRWETISDDVMEIVQLARSENPDKKLFVLGHSMGGYAAACFATRFPKMADGIILSGALTRYNNQLAGPLPLPLDPDTYLPNELGDGVCSDPAVVEAYASDPLVKKMISAALFNSMGEGVEFLKNNPSAFIDPVLILHGCYDGLVSPMDSIQLFSEIGSRDKSLFIFANLFHEILNEPVRDEILRNIIVWLNARC